MTYKNSIIQKLDTFTSYLVSTSGGCALAYSIVPDLSSTNERGLAAIGGIALLGIGAYIKGNVQVNITQEETQEYQQKRISKLEKDLYEFKHELKEKEHTH